MAIYGERGRGSGLERMKRGDGRDARGAGSGVAGDTKAENTCEARFSSHPSLSTSLGNPSEPALGLGVFPRRRRPKKARTRACRSSPDPDPDPVTEAETDAVLLLPTLSLFPFFHLPLLKLVGAAPWLSLLNVASLLKPVVAPSPPNAPAPPIASPSPGPLYDPVPDEALPNPYPYPHESVLLNAPCDEMLLSTSNEDAVALRVNMPEDGEVGVGVRPLACPCPVMLPSGDPNAEPSRTLWLWLP